MPLRTAIIAFTFCCAFTLAAKETLANCVHENGKLRTKMDAPDCKEKTHTVGPDSPGITTKTTLHNALDYDDENEGMDFGHHHARRTEFNFVLFGPTGSGKTTISNYAIASGLRDVLTERAGHASANTSSQTRDVVRSASNYMSSEDKSEEYALAFYDTPGHGASDEKVFSNSTSLIKRTLDQLLKKTHTLNGVILVVKMERYRADLDEALKQYITMFKKFELDKKSFMVAITHSLQYNDQVKDQYRRNIHKLFEEHVLLENVRHVNFVMLNELQPEFAKLYKKAVTSELKGFRRHLTTKFRNPHNIRHWMDKQSGLGKWIDDMFQSAAKKMRL